MPMKHFFRVTLLLWFSCAAMIVAAGRIGSMRSASPLFNSLFTHPDGSVCPPPCLFGVKPGQTNIQQAREILSLHPITKDLTPPDGISNEYSYKGAEYSVFVDAQIRYIILAYNTPRRQGAKIIPIEQGPLGRPMLGDFIANFGAPQESWDVGGNPRSFAMLYQSARFVPVFKINSFDHVTPDQPLVGIGVFASVHEVGLGQQAHHWYGFTVLRRYPM
jgi:hypothetical protein